jgi:hypothetical protein
LNIQISKKIKTYSHSNSTHGGIMKGKVTICGLVAIFTIALVFLVTTSIMSQGTKQGAMKKTEKTMKKTENMVGSVARGKYLVRLSSCTDCHSPKIMTAMGPMDDTTRYLSGSPSTEKIPDIPAGIIAPDKWGALSTNDQTGWAGPWGMSFAFNLTPDKQTGTGAWTQDIFIKTMRTGKHMGAGRDILPPMPWPSLAKAKDEDLASIFAYLQSLPAIQNQVPIPIPPAGAKAPDEGKK